jgi:hypothetical protein
MRYPTKFGATLKKKGGYVRKELVESYTTELKQSLGLWESVSEKELRALYKAKDYAGMVRHIKRVLRIELIVRVMIVKKGGEDCPAWIRMPMLIPLYGTEALRLTTVELYIQSSFLKDSNFEQVVMAIAHELCHVVLKCIGHPLQKEEVAVDITAMLCGFRNFYMKGCEVTYVRRLSFWERLWGIRSHSTKLVLGYLTREEVTYAMSYMTSS